MTEDLTPKHLKCGFGSCPSVHRLNDGRLRIVGEFDREHGVTTERGKPSEAAIVISPDLLGTLIEEKVREAVLVEWERCAVIACDLHWVLPMYASAAVNEATDDAAEYVRDEIVNAIRANPPINTAPDTTNEG